jgi:hypothetical protein
VGVSIFLRCLYRLIMSRHFLIIVIISFIRASVMHANVHTHHYIRIAKLTCDNLIPSLGCSSMNILATTKYYSYFSQNHVSNLMGKSCDFTTLPAIIFFRPDTVCTLYLSVNIHPRLPRILTNLLPTCQFYLVLSIPTSLEICNFYVYLNSNIFIIMNNFNLIIKIKY